MFSRFVGTAGLHKCSICTCQVKPGRLLVGHGSFQAHKRCLERYLEKCPPDEDEAEKQVEKIAEFILSGGTY